MIKLEEILKLLNLEIESLEEKEKKELESLLLSYNEKLESLESYIYSQEQDENLVEQAVKNMALFIEDEN